MGAYERRAGDMMPRLLDEIEHERQTVDTLRDNICVMTVESLDDKDEIKRLKGLVLEQNDAIYRARNTLTGLFHMLDNGKSVALTENGIEALFEDCKFMEAMLSRPDVAELREE